MKRKYNELFWGCFILLSGVVGIVALLPPPIQLEPIDQQLESIDGMTYEGPRASEWVQVRNEFVRRHPRCEACGSGCNLNVHHIVPFHERPDLELAEDNLITLCREHHFRIGHDPDGKGPRKPSWLESNPNVRSDAANMRSSKQTPN